MNPKSSGLIAFAFLATWLSILYVGADHPPPRGFLCLVMIAIACADGVYLRALVYAGWSHSRRPGRFMRVKMDGLAAGIIVGSTVLLLPFTGEPSTGAVRVWHIMIWLSVLAVVGAANTVILYGVASLFHRYRL
jgi:hypothetical protein